ncbi:L-arabinonate dehydratase [Marinobacterium rhizophilum]|uniref:Dihydroxy-acid dehydratase n=1 Tax=Marinobacterium rhizophilum TaxID=420402 RepID=A0ABY5HQC9_9GAMM|nr:L-arabinonate dehydratase [Marinobacterium rhizophilum]UTW13414.1 dihydroxy-acid dehydratase [Marinobacterium rhizophilum]
MSKDVAKLRSNRWFGDKGLRTFGHRSRMMQMGYDPIDWEGRPIIAIINTWSDINPCHAHFRNRVEFVKTGILQSGGFPLELPAISLAEQFVKPSAMMYRNMLAMEVEELIRSHPIDGAVLMGGCDKTTPALLMGAVSMNVPSIYLPAGPMLRGNWQGKTLGSGSDSWKYWDELRAGNITRADWEGVERGIARSYGHCMTMGTASTMTAIADALGMTLPGASSIPAADSNHITMSKAVGRRIVDMVWEDLLPTQILQLASFQNAIAVAMAMGCSTNAIIHVIAMARRAGVSITLDDFDAASRKVPVVANVRPSGETYLMEDFYYAGGLPALMKQIESHLDLSMISVTGRPLSEDISNARVFNEDVIRSIDNPIYEEGALAVLRGNLAPHGCVIKPSACSAKFLDHTGPALVFDSYEELKECIDDEDLDVTEDSILVLRNAGPVGGPGMPEWGMLPIPQKLLRAGVRDMLRISDARMSGTSYGACVLHISPEAHIGGPLALLRTGDIIRVNIRERSINMQVSDSELEDRRASWIPREEPFGRGFGKMYSTHVSQAHDGCDFDFLQTAAGAAVPEPKIF